MDRADRTSLKWLGAQSRNWNVELWSVITPTSLGCFLTARLPGNITSEDQRDTGRNMKGEKESKTKLYSSAIESDALSNPDLQYVQVSISDVHIEDAGQLGPRGPESPLSPSHPHSYHMSLALATYFKLRWFSVQASLSIVCEARINWRKGGPRRYRGIVAYVLVLTAHTSHALTRSTLGPHSASKRLAYPLPSLS